MTTPEKVASLRRAVRYGVQHGKKNVIADLEPLDYLFTLLDELDLEMDGVAVPASAAAILNALRAVLEDKT